MNAARDGFAGGRCGAARGWLHALWDGEIEDADRRALDAHLELCAECRAFADRGDALRAALAALPDPAFPDDALAAVFAATVDRARPDETRGAALTIGARFEAPAATPRGIDATERERTHSRDEIRETRNTPSGFGATERERRGARAPARRRFRPRIALAVAACAAALVVAFVAADGRRAAERERIRRAEADANIVFAIARGALARSGAAALDDAVGRGIAPALRAAPILNSAVDAPRGRRN